MNANEQAQALLRLFSGDLDKMDQYQTATDQLVRSVLDEIAGTSRVSVARVVAAFRHGEVGVTEAFWRILEQEQPGVYSGVYFCECCSRFVLLPITGEKMPGKCFFRGRLRLAADWNGLPAGTVVLWRDADPPTEDNFADLMALCESGIQGMPLEFDVAIMQHQPKPKRPM